MHKRPARIRKQGELLLVGLLAFAGLVLSVVLGSCAMGGSSGASESAHEVQQSSADEDSAADESDTAGTDSNSGGSDTSGAQTDDSKPNDAIDESNDAATDSTGEAYAAGEEAATDPTESNVTGASILFPTEDTSAIDPHALVAGDVLTAEDVERAGGEDAFFWAEEIPDEVFSRMEGKSFGPTCTLARSDLRYVRVLHADAEGNTIVGELVVNALVADEVVDIFRQLYDEHYPIKKMHLVDDYDADDDASCADGNTAAFNYRNIVFSDQLSNHAYGLAIDINTFENPYYIPSTGYVWPPEAAPYLDRTRTDPYMIHVGDLCYNLFLEHGWSWGGNWGSPKDYQHFEKPRA